MRVNNVLYKSLNVLVALAMMLVTVPVGGVIAVDTAGPVVDTISAAENRAALDVTDFDLWQSTNFTDWNEVPGSYDHGFVMVLNPLVDFYYLDTNNITPSLTDGLYPFYLDVTKVLPDDFYTDWELRGVDEDAVEGTWEEHMYQIIMGLEPMFYLNVVGTDYMLVDGLQKDFVGGSDQYLRINGDYTLGAYTFYHPVDGDLELEPDIVVNIFFTDTAYTINATAGTGGSIDPSGEVPVAEGENQSFTITADSGYRIEDVLVDSVPEGAVASYTFINVTANHTIVASFEQVFTISGTVTEDSVGLAGVTMTYGVGQTVTTAANGTYSITVDHGWAGTITPSKAGYSFVPTVRDYELTPVVANLVGQDFAATMNTYTITGTVTEDSVGLAGVTMTYGVGQTVTTAANGTYSITVDHGWAGTITPSKAGYSFVPTVRDYELTPVVANLVGQDFAATMNTYTITGTVTEGSVGLEGVTLTYGTGLTEPTAADGTYSITVPYDWTGTVTPTKADYRFVPTNQNYSNVTENKVNQDYSAIRLFTLTMAVAPSGGGTIIPAEGSYIFDEGTVVDIEAAPNSGYRFSHWTGGVSSSSSASTTVTINADKTVTANFVVVYTLSVFKGGNGAGTVLSDPVGISCGSSCSADFDINTEVTLTAVALTGSSFTGWSGACSGTGTCTVTMSQAREVTATFTLNKYTLTVSKVGEGTVTSSPTGIACGSTCSALFDYGTTVTLTAVPANGYSFTGWTGVNGGEVVANQILINENKSVTANFETGIIITAVDDYYEMAKGGRLDVTAVDGVLINDYGPSSEISLYAQRIIGTGPAQGVLVFDSSGGFSLFDVPSTFVGTLYFDYKACDVATDICSEPATVTITVKTVPTAVADNYIMGLSTVLTVAAPGVLANDSGGAGAVLTATVVTNPVGGTLTLNPDGSFTYTQTAAWIGSDSFTYKACDGTICSAPATVTIEETDSCLVVDPASLQKTLTPDATGALDLTLINTCDVPVSFNLVESGVVTGSLVLDEGFEAVPNLTLPPTGWEVIETADRTWFLTAGTGFVDEGQYAAFVNYAEVGQDTDEWLISPILDTSSLNNLVLSFRAYSRTNPAYTGATMKVWVLTSGEDKVVWDLFEDVSWDTYQYRTVQIDLSEFDAYDEIQIAWQYVSVDSSVRGETFGLDAVKVGGQSAIPWLSQSPTSGTIAGGGDRDVTVTFNSTGLSFGRYEGMLFVRNAPYPVINVPVTLIVSSDEEFLYFLPLITK